MASSVHIDSTRSFGDGRSRMLGVVALTGAAALLVGCGIQQAPSSTPTGPGSPPVAITGADPVPLDDAVLQDLRVMDEVAAEGTLVRWLEPGTSIAIVLGGSGGGGECIPQPHAAGLEPTAPSIVVRFDPPNPEVMCTADFALHGWELALAEPIDASGVVPVRLVNQQGDEATVEVELGPDDVLTAPTADPQPSEISGDAEAPAPTAIPAAQLPELSIIDPMQDPAVAVQWVEPGVSLAVMLGGSGAEQCVPQPIGASSTGPGTIEVAFEYPTGDMDCSTDLRLYGWQVSLPEAVSATMPVEVTVSGAGAEGATATVTVEPDDILAG